MYGKPPKDDLKDSNLMCASANNHLVQVQDDRYSTGSLGSEPLGKKKKELSKLGRKK